MSRYYKAPKGFTKVTEVKDPHIDDGAVVYIEPPYLREDESPRKYCVCELPSGNHYLIADNKRMLNQGEGYIYSIWQIAYYKNF